MRELIIDNFAGGGGASTGIELAIGRSVDIAINHDPAAIAMHKANHPTTKHYCENVWEVDPKEAVGNNKVALAWFSPDCKHFSKAKGGKPVEKKIRGLAWIVLKWAGKVRPRVIILENVEEFQTWGPLKKGRPIKSKKGETFGKWKQQLESLGYVVEHRELKACDYGAPTIRKRFFLIARCDGKKIVWPEPTHGPKDSLDVICGLRQPYKTAADIIDWNIPCKSIFERSKPLAENTLKRIAKGLEKFVFNNPEPFIKSIGQEECLVTPTLIQYHTETSKAGVRGQKVDEPLMTLDSSPRYGLVSAFISKSYAGESRSVASSMDDGIHTITARACHSLVEVKLDTEVNSHYKEVEEYLKKYYGKPVFGDKANQSFLIKYYGNDVGQDINTPLGTVVSKDRFGLITIKGIDYKIVDIGLRMLEPHELFAAQGFPKDYIIDKDFEGKVYPKTKQVARCGNAVPPPFAKALVEANLPELCKELKQVI